jgi:hypothetical protein
MAFLTNRLAAGAAIPKCRRRPVRIARPERAEAPAGKPQQEEGAGMGRWKRVEFMTRSVGSGPSTGHFANSIRRFFPDRSLATAR